MKIPDKPVMTPEATVYPKLKKIKTELDNQNNLIFQAEISRKLKEQNKDRGAR